MKIKNVTNAIITISKQNIASSRDAALLTRDATLLPGAEMLLYDFVAENLVSLRDLIDSGKIQVVNGDQPADAPTIGVPGFSGGGGSSQWLDSAPDIYFTAGKVGIGVSSPDTKLHVVGSIKMVDGNQLLNRILTSDSNGVASWERYLRDEAGTLSVQFQDRYLADNTGVDVLNYNSTGKIGINTNAPDAALHIVGTLKIVDGAQGANKVLTSDAAGLASWETPAGGSSQWLDSAPDIYFTAGNVGIGTSTPAAKLNIVGATDGTLFRFSDLANSTLYASVTATPFPGVRLHADNAFYFGGNGVDTLMISVDGKVGIGTTTPSSKLHVVGLVEFADNADAITNGLADGAFYRTGDLLKVVHL